MSDRHQINIGKKIGMACTMPIFLLPAFLDTAYNILVRQQAYTECQMIIQHSGQLPVPYYKAHPVYSFL